MFLFERNPRSTIKKGRKAPKTTVVCCRTSDALKAEVDGALPAQQPHDFRISEELY